MLNRNLIPQRVMRTWTGTALNHAEPADAFPRDMAALCFTIPAGDVPDWIEVIPAADTDGIVRGRDGRWWRMPNPQAIADAYDLPIPIDINHATETQALMGEEAPAQGWIEKLEVRDGAIWGQVGWTERGTNAVKARDYRFLSSAFRFDRESLEILKVTSVGLVNVPNFPTALNHRNPEEDITVDKAIREALGLDDKATPESAVVAINALKQARDTALNSAQQPSLDKFVPRADYDTALNRATTAEQQLADRNQTDLESKVDTAINAALQAGKITPATKDYHRAQCLAEGGLERFDEFVKAAPVIGDPSGLEGRTPETEKKALNAATANVAQLFGNSVEDIQKYGTEDQQ